MLNFQIDDDRNHTNLNLSYFFERGDAGGLCGFRIV